LAVIGSGPIGCELAQVFARFGAEVDLLEIAPRILGREDEDASRLVAQSLADDGVRIHLGVEIKGVAPAGESTILELQLSDGPQKLMVDEILVGVGRAPNVEGLDLEAAGVEYDPRGGVHVDDRLRTTNPRVFAAGDICSRFKFTHAADAMARIVIQNALFLGRAKASALTIPWCTYTDPEVAHVGLDPREAE
jgi:pyruvate/2-oxoglutarate dehydrogenase complex dihydrolipoamide dehydrogenase (E3) component